MTDKVLYEELVPQEFRERLAAAAIAYLPLGTLEWHGEHLPLGADGIQARGFFERLARRVGGIVLPMLFVGPDRIQVGPDGSELYGMDICHVKNVPPYPDQQLAGSAYRVPDETFAALLDEVMKQLARAGFRIVVGHGHGPSTGHFTRRADEWRDRFGLVCFNCWDPAGHPEGLGIQVDHAAMNETSLVMALRPELVQMDRLAAAPDKFPVGVGGRDPRAHASREFGEKAIRVQLDRMAALLEDALKGLSE
jgi:creatinine amidohydrolase